MTQQTEFQKFGFAASLAKKADRLGLHLRWLHDGWRAEHDVVKGNSHGKTLESLAAFLKGFEMGLTVAEEDDGEPGDIEVDDDFGEGWCCDNPNCDCHHADDEEDPDADEGDDDGVPF